MKSPFPGMDPYIEECGFFADFHQKLIGEIERDLSRTGPGGTIGFEPPNVPTS